MTAIVQHVLVIGAGIGGLACALACASAGLRVDVLESRLAFAQVPVHVNVVPNLLRDLVRLGVAEDCVRAGFVYQGVAFVDESGKQQFELATPKLAGQQYPAAVGIAFDQLHALLRRAVLTAGATISMDSAVVEIDTDQGFASLANGMTLAADLIVLSTGAGSRLVEQVHVRAADGDIAQTWWHSVIPRPQRLDRATWMIGERGRRLLLLPIGSQLSGIAVCDPKLDPENNDGAALAALLASWGELPRRLAGLLTELTPTTLRTAASGLLAAPWGRGAVLITGASAHAISSPFGQSAAQAVEDAVVLGELLAATRDRDELLGLYMDRRIPRVSRVHALTRQAARWISRPEPATDLGALAEELDSLLAEPA